MNLLLVLEKYVQIYLNQQIILNQMKVVYNGEVLNDSEITFNLNDRGFLFGDGFFETFFCSKHNIPYFKEHYERILAAFKVFNFDLGSLPSLNDLQETICKTVSFNKLPNARIKIIFWRKEGGLYNTTNTSFNYLINITNLEINTTKNKSATFQKKGTNTSSNFSKFKPLSGFKYIHAGLELNSSNHEEIILLSDSEKISEALYSNIFWCKDHVFYTPSLKTGCIDGIMRKIIIEYFKSKNIKTNLCESTMSELLNADFVFTCNSLNIQSVIQIDDNYFQENPLIENLRSELLTKYLN